MKRHVECLPDKSSFVKLTLHKDDELAEIALTLLVGLLYPELMEKVREGELDAFAAAHTLQKSPSSFEAFVSAARALEKQISEGEITLHNPEALRHLAERLGKGYPTHRFRAGSYGTVLCQWVCEAVAYYDACGQLSGKKAQLDQMRKELDATQALIDEADTAAGRGGFNHLQVRSVQEAISKSGGAAPPVEQVQWALKRAGGYESSAVEMLAALPAARKVVRALESPHEDLFGSAGSLGCVSLAQVRRVRLALKRDGVRALVDALGEGALGEPPDGASRAEMLLLGWAREVCEYVEAASRTQPQHQKVLMSERKVAERQAAFNAALEAQRSEVVAKAAALQLPADLFPAATPWKFFPWERQLLPRAEAEEGLRTAIGLRDLAHLNEQLKAARTLKLSSTTSRVFFEAVELRDLLEAEAAIAAAAEAAARAAADEEATSSDAASSAMKTTADGVKDADAAIGNDAADSNEHSKPVEPTSSTLGDALDVFVETVSTEVPATLPRARPFVEVLSERASQFGAFLRSSTDLERRDAILAAASGATGASDIETEQCREQEQEKAQEQEQEQEIEMERYVDMAYQRDNEEPRRWAFVSLAGAEGPPPAVFDEGTFYPAAQFRLHSRAPLPFPSCLSVSRNHFNLDWVGERRLKNAVMVLEYVPSVARLRRLPPEVPALDAEQSERVDAALSLLSLRPNGRFARRELAQALRAAEHEDPDASLLDRLLTSVADSRGADGALEPTMSAECLRRLLVTGDARRGDSGRHFVLLSLAEVRRLPRTFLTTLHEPCTSPP